MTKLLIIVATAILFTIPSSASFNYEAEDLEDFAGGQGLRTDVSSPDAPTAILADKVIACESGGQRCYPQN